jgi:hypothetical protein
MLLGFRVLAGKFAFTKDAYIFLLLPSSSHIPLSQIIFQPYQYAPPCFIPSGFLATIVLPLILSHLASSITIFVTVSGQFLQ